MDINETIIMSVGGSLIVPDQIDTVFLKTLKTFIDTETALAVVLLSLLAEARLPAVIKTLPLKWPP